MKKISLLFLLAMMMASAVSAVSIDIDVKDVFGLGDTITFDYMVHRD